METGAGVGDQVLRRRGRRGGRRHGEWPRAVPALGVRAVAPPGLLPAALLPGQQPGVGHHDGHQQQGWRRRRGGDGGGPAAAALVQPQRAPRRDARLLRDLPAGRGRVRRRVQGLRRRRHAPGDGPAARRREAAQRRRIAGPPGVARRGNLPGPVPAPAPRPAAWLLLRGRGAPPRLRVHAPRQPREPPLQEDLGDASMGHADPGGHRRRQGALLPPRRRHARHLPGLQSLQHPARLGFHGEAVGLRAGEDGSRGRGHARDDARDGHPRLRGSGVRADGAPQREERRVQLRRRPPGAPHRPPRHGARPQPQRARGAAGEARGLDPPLPQRRQPPAALYHGREAGGPLLRQGRARRGAAGGAVHGGAAAGQAADGRRGGGPGAAAGAQGHGRQRRTVVRRRAGRREECHLGKEPRRRQRRVAAEERVLQAALIDRRSASWASATSPSRVDRRVRIRIVICMRACMYIV